MKLFLTLTAANLFHYLSRYNHHNNYAVVSAYFSVALYIWAKSKIHLQLFLITGDGLVWEKHRFPFNFNLFLTVCYIFQIALSQNK